MDKKVKLYGEAMIFNFINLHKIISKTSVLDLLFGHYQRNSSAVCYSNMATNIQYTPLHKTVVFLFQLFLKIKVKC